MMFGNLETKKYEPGHNKTSINTVLQQGIVLWTLRFFRKKNQYFYFLHMIHQIYIEFPRDYEYAIQKIFPNLTLLP